MKVGILTVHRAINIGAILQTYALQEVLRGMGHEVRVIDYVQEKVERVDREPFGLRKWLLMVGKGHLRGALFFKRLRERVRRQRKIFDDFLKEQLLLSDSCAASSIPGDFDAYVIGSDQLWNSHIFEGRHDQVFWGNFRHRKDAVLMAYACSTTPEDLAKSDAGFIARSLRNFRHVSVREGDTAEYLNEKYLSENPAEWVLDPTLTAESELWHRMATGKFRKEKYILYYAARTYSPAPDLLLEKTRELAERMGCKVKTLHMDSVSDYIDLINDAKVVVSSSFHGIVFSLIFNKPLLAVTYGDNQDKRYVSLLNRIGASGMLVDINSAFEIPETDYAAVNANIAAWREESRAFLNRLNQNAES